MFQAEESCVQRPRGEGGLWVFVNQQGGQCGRSWVSKGRRRHLASCFVRQLCQILLAGFPWVPWMNWGSKSLRPEPSEEGQWGWGRGGGLRGDSRGKIGRIQWFQGWKKQQRRVNDEWFILTIMRVTEAAAGWGGGRGGWPAIKWSYPVSPCRVDNGLVLLGQAGGGVQIWGRRGCSRRREQWESVETLALTRWVTTTSTVGGS